MPTSSDSVLILDPEPPLGPLDPGLAVGLPDTWQRQLTERELRTPLLPIKPFGLLKGGFGPPKIPP